MSLIADSLKNALKDKSGKNKIIPEINLLGTSRKPELSGLRKAVPLIVIPGAILFYLVYAGAFDKRRTTLTQLPIWRSLGLLMKGKTPPPVTAQRQTIPQPIPQPAPQPAPSSPPPIVKAPEMLEKPAVVEKGLESIAVKEIEKNPAPPPATTVKAPEILKQPAIVEKGLESVAVKKLEKKLAPPPSVPATPPRQSKVVPKKRDMAMVNELEDTHTPTPLASRAKETKPKPKDTAFRKAESKKSPPARSPSVPAPAKPVPEPEIFKNSEYYFNQAIFFQQAGDLEKALESYRKAAEFSKNDNPDIYNNMGVIYKDLGKYNEALEALVKTVYLDPNYAKAYNNLGVVYYLKKNYAAAVASYEKAIAIKPKNVEAYNNLSVAYKKMQQPDKAKNVLNMALSIDANHPGTNYNLALLYEEEGAAKAALHFYRRFLEFGEANHPELVAEVKEHIKALQ